MYLKVQNLSPSTSILVPCHATQQAQSELTHKPERLSFCFSHLTWKAADFQGISLDGLILNSTWHKNTFPVWILSLSTNLPQYLTDITPQICWCSLKSMWLWSHWNLSPGSLTEYNYLTVSSEDKVHKLPKLEKEFLWGLHEIIHGNHSAYCRALGKHSWTISYYHCNILKKS